MHHQSAVCNQDLWVPGKARRKVLLLLMLAKAPGHLSAVSRRWLPEVAGYEKPVVAAYAKLVVAAYVEPVWQ